MEIISILGPVAMYLAMALANKYKIPFHPFGGGDSPAPKPADPATPAPQTTPVPAQPTPPKADPSAALADLLTQLNSMLFAVKIGGGTLGADLKAAAPAIRHVLDQIDPPAQAK